MPTPATEHLNTGEGICETTRIECSGSDNLLFNGVCCCREPEVFAFRRYFLTKRPSEREGRMWAGGGQPGNLEEHTPCESGSQPVREAGTRQGRSS